MSSKTSLAVIAAICLLGASVVTRFVVPGEIRKRQNSILSTISPPHLAQIDDNGQLFVSFDYRKLGQGKRSRRQFGEADIAAIVSVPMLREVDVSYSNFDDRLAKILIQSNSLRKLIAIDTYLSPEMATSLVERITVVLE